MSLSPAIGPDDFVVLARALSQTIRPLPSSVMAASRRWAEMIGHQRFFGQNAGSMVPKQSKTAGFYGCSSLKLWKTMVF